MIEKKTNAFYGEYTNKTNLHLWLVTILFILYLRCKKYAFIRILKIAKNYHNKFQFQFFSYLLALLLAGRRHFFLKISLMGLAISLVINRVIFMI